MAHQLNTFGQTKPSHTFCLFKGKFIRALLLDHCHSLQQDHKDLLYTTHGRLKLLKHYVSKC